MPFGYLAAIIADLHTFHRAYALSRCTSDPEREAMHYKWWLAERAVEIEQQAARTFWGHVTVGAVLGGAIVALGSLA